MCVFCCTGDVMYSCTQQIYTRMNILDEDPSFTRGHGIGHHGNSHVRAGKSGNASPPSRSPAGPGRRQTRRHSLGVPVDKHCVGVPNKKRLSRTDSLAHGIGTELVAVLNSGAIINDNVMTLPNQPLCDPPKGYKPPPSPPIMVHHVTDDEEEEVPLSQHARIGRSATRGRHTSPSTPIPPGRRRDSVGVHTSPNTPTTPGRRSESVHTSPNTPTIPGRRRDSVGLYTSPNTPIPSGRRSASMHTSPSTPTTPGRRRESVHLPNSPSVNAPSFAGIVQKHISSLKNMSSMQGNGSLEKDLQHEHKTKRGAMKAIPHLNSVFSSCPNLVSSQEGPSQDFQITSTSIRMCKSTDGRLGKVPISPTESSSSSPSLLTVPDIFTTSFTHSKTHPSVFFSDDDEHVLKEYRRSAPELGRMCTRSNSVHTGSPTGKPKQCLKKSYSDTPILSTRRTPENTEELKPVEVVKKPSGSGRRVTCVLENQLYLGNIEAGYHQPLICHTHISGLLDVSQLLPEDVPSGRKSLVSCSCSSTFTHQPATLRISFNPSDLLEIRSHFAKANKFIEGNLTRDNRVLIMCQTGDNLSALMATQFLMQSRQMKMNEALEHVKGTEGSVSLCVAYKELLLGLERKLYGPQEPLKIQPPPRRSKIRREKESVDNLERKPKNAWMN